MNYGETELKYVSMSARKYPILRCVEWVESLYEGPYDEQGVKKYHKRSHEEISCDWLACTFTATNEMAFNQHVQIHINELNIIFSKDNTEELKCGWSGCVWRGHDMAALRRGVGAHAWNALLCARGQAILSAASVPPCSRSPPNKDDFSDLHSRPPLVCRWHDCTHVFNDVQTFYMHVKCHSLGAQVKDRPYRQMFIRCGWAGCGLKVRLSHVATHTGERGAACPHCRATFANSAKLVNHCERQNVPSDIHTCAQCDSSFGSARLLRMHSAVHRSPQHECHLCGERFFSNSMLARHHRYRHLTDRPHSCPHCPYSAVTLRDLRKHERRIHCCTLPQAERMRAELKQNYACHLCESRLAGAASLTRHFRTHHKMHSQTFRYEKCLDGVHRLLEWQEASSLEGPIGRSGRDEEGKESEGEEYRVVMKSAATHTSPASFAVCLRDIQTPPNQDVCPLQIHIEELDEDGNILNYSIVDARTSPSML